MLLDASSESASQTRTLLHKFDIEIKEWSVSGTGWIAAFQKLRPDFFLAEYSLPKRDGIFCINKAHELFSPARGILLHSFTGFLANEIEMQALSAGAHAIVQKPIAEKRLERLLARLGDMRRAETSQLRKSIVLAK